MEKAPYWGELPPANVVRANSGKHAQEQGQRGNNGLSVDTSLKGNRLSSQSQSRSNRYSNQTDAPTLSTQSPFASPIASEFRGEGLAPRPSSYSYNAGEPTPNDEFYERRRRRQNRNREQNANEPAVIPPPRAPDVPRAPPSSYRPPQGTLPRQSNPQTRSVPPGVEEYNRNARRESHPTGGEQVRRPSNGKAAVRERLNGQSTNGPRRADSTRSQTTEAEAQRRREWAPDRSPLQRLELTLDGITKEEKRARVEEAELLARDKKANKGLERTNQGSLRVRNKPISNPIETATQQESQVLPESDLNRNSSHRQQDQLPRKENIARKRAAITEEIPIDAKSEYEPGPDVISTKPRRQENGPQERIAESRERPIVQHTMSGALPAPGVVRSTSNKLKKKPPPEMQYHGMDSRNPSGRYQSRGSQQPEDNLRAVPRGSVANRQFQHGVEKDLPSLPHGSRDHVSQQAPSLSDEEIQVTPSARRGTQSKVERLTGQKLPAQDQYGYSDDEQDTTPVQKGSMSKIERLMGQKPPVEGQFQQPEEGTGKPVRRGSLLQRLTGATAKFSPQRSQSVKNGRDIQTEVVKVNGVKYDVPPPASVSSEQSQALSRDIQAKQGHRHLHLSDVLHRHEQVPGHGSYLAGPRLDEWKKGGVALLAGPLLDLETAKAPVDTDKDKTWWEKDEAGTRRRNSTKQRKAEAYDGEYDDTSVPTRFKPALFMKCGPLLRYCGMRTEKLKSRSIQKTNTPDREIWRGSIMIVTQDSQSSYELAPTLRLFVQPVDLMPPPPDHVKGEDLAPEYIDPLAGLTKVGRDGRTLYIRPVDHLEEGVDLSQEESDEGLFEMHKSPLDGVGDQKPVVAKPQYDGERAGKYKDVRGFRLHAEHGVTFWRFNIEVELRDKQQRIAYRINRGPATAFWVPAKHESMNIMFYSCNGFSHDIDPNKFSGPDPMWRDVLNTHQTQPFHVMLGGGDQVYNDPVMDETTLFKEWLEMHDPHQKSKLPFTPEIQKELEIFYLNRYALWFSSGLFGVANSQIPMVNIFDDHDIIDGFGSYPDHYMKSPVMSGLGAVAFKYYMLFQHQSSIDEGEENESSWILGSQPGPYINELSRTVLTNLGRGISFLGLDCRTERMNDEIVSAETYHKVFDRLERDIVKGETKHLLVMVGVPMAYPRMVWLENILTSRAIAPLKAMGRAGWLGKGLLNKFDGGVEVLDDLDDHWTARHHKEERNWFIQELQDLAAEKSVRVTLLGGDVHLGAVGQFYSNPKLAIPKDKDFRYMPNIISSAIVNTPPPNTLADILNRRNKVHHLDDVTDEDMIPIFTHDVNGKARNNKRLLNRRNWCAIRSFDPSESPPSSPASEGTPTPPPARGGLFRRLSAKGPSYRPDLASPTAPPLSSQGFFARRPSATISRRNSTDSAQRPGALTRTLSLTRKDFMPGLFRRNSNKRRQRDEINGYGSETEDGYYTDEQTPQQLPATRPLRGGSGGPEDNESYFPPMPRSNTISHPPSSTATLPQRGQFHRTPTGLSEKQARKHAGTMDINLEGGLDITLNMEVNQRDPAGITVPYRLLVPALWYGDISERTVEDVEREKAERPGGLKRLMSLGGGSKRAPPRKEVLDEDSYSDESDEQVTPGPRGTQPAPVTTTAPAPSRQGVSGRGAQKWY